MRNLLLRQTVCIGLLLVLRAYSWHHGYRRSHHAVSAPGKLSAVSTNIAASESENPDKGRLREHPEQSDPSSLLVSEVAEYGIMTALAGEHIHLKNYEEAVKLAEEAIEMAGHAHERNNIYAAYAEGILADALYGEGHFEESAKHYRDALKTYQHHYQNTGGPEAVEMVGAMQIVAWNLLSKKEFEDAKSACATALGMTERLLGPSNIDVAASMVNLAIAHLRQGDAGPGTEALLQRALKVYLEKQLEVPNTNFGEEPGDATLNVPISLIYNVLGDSYFERGLDNEATDAYGKVDLMNRQGAISDRRAANSLINLAAIEWQRGKRDVAERLLSRVLQVLQRSPQHVLDGPTKVDSIKKYLASIRAGEPPPSRSQILHLQHAKWV